MEEKRPSAATSAGQSVDDGTEQNTQTHTATSRNRRGNIFHAQVLFSDHAMPVSPARLLFCSCLLLCVSFCFLSLNPFSLTITLPAHLHSGVLYLASPNRMFLPTSTLLEQMEREVVQLRSPPASLVAHKDPAAKPTSSSRRKKRRRGAPACLSACKEESPTAPAATPGAITPRLVAASKPASSSATSVSQARCSSAHAVFARSSPVF
ncbi:hypothetical protein AMECASPLE_034313 [Ameca splendens]|uniref:Transmembrane protein n=1 Tax=Ameca splendens TaxID=208324 RepID=A0ABV0XK33_9TELE